MINYYQTLAPSINGIKQQEQKEAQKTEKHNREDLRNENEMETLSLTHGTTIQKHNTAS